MRMRAASVAVLASVMLWIGASASEAQQPPQPRPAPGPAAPGGPGQPRRPVRDPRAAPAEGTATVRGRVVDAVTGVGVPRAKVRISGRDMRSSRVATTDTEGVFTLTRIPAGALMMSVEKTGYVPSMYPERRRSLRVANVSITDGQTIDNISIPLSRGGVITGRVIDAYGDPVENVMIHAIPAAQSNRSAPFRVGGMRAFQGSNDAGEFRIPRLEPGVYYLYAAPQRNMGNRDDDSGSAPGRTYFPGVPSVETAQPITVERGAVVAGVDFQMIETTLTKVSGIVLNAKGEPARGGNISARSTANSNRAGSVFMGMPDGGGTGVDQNGAFEFTLQPGEYILEAMAGFGEGGPRPQGRMEMDRGQVRLTVGGEAMSGVTIATGAGGTVSGRFVFKGSGTPPTSFGGFNVGFVGPNGNSVGGDCRAFGRPTANADGTFTADNVWGTCEIRGTGMAKGWAFEAVMHNGNDITHRPIEYGLGRSINGIEIVYTDRVGDLALEVADDRGTPTQDYVAIAFPVDKEKWTDQRFFRFQVRSAANAQAQTAGAAGGAAGATAGRMMAAASLVPATDPYAGMINSTFSAPVMGGSNSFAGLVAGDYYAVALDDASYEDFRDVEYFERLSQIATRVSVSVGGQQSIQLRRVPAPQP